MNGLTIEISTLIALGSLVVALAALVGGVLFRQGKIEGKVDLLIQEGKESREEFRQEMRDMREENRQEIRDMREENRRNHQQLLQALAHHSHDPDTGFAIFRIPPGTENPAG